MVIPEADNYTQVVKKKTLKSLRDELEIGKNKDPMCDTKMKWCRSDHKGRTHMKATQYYTMPVNEDFYLNETTHRKFFDFICCGKYRLAEARA